MTPEIPLFYHIFHKLLSDVYPTIGDFPVDTIRENQREYSTVLYKTSDAPTITVGLLFGMHISKSNHTKLSKLQWLHSMLVNKFIHIDIQTIIEDKFRKAQCLYRRLCRLVYKYKWNKTPVSIDHDLYLNPISANQVNVIYLLHNGRKYAFTLRDLIHNIESSLTNSPNMFAEPLVCKNPYTNIPFSKAELYNIYFAIKHGICVMSPIIHNYFLENFHLKHFRDNNEVLIRNIAISRLVHSNDTENLYYSIRRMISKHNSTANRRRRLLIHPSFPKDKLVDIMRPYVQLYYTSLYSLDNVKRNDACLTLETRLNHFARYNNCFGRRYVILQKNSFLSEEIISRYTYNDTHLPWTKVNSNKNYETSHLEIVESDSDSEDSPDNTDHHENWFGRSDASETPLQTNILASLFRSSTRYESFDEDELWSNGESQPENHNMVSDNEADDEQQSTANFVLPSYIIQMDSEFNEMSLLNSTHATVDAANLDTSTGSG